MAQLAALPRRAYVELREAPAPASPTTFVNPTCALALACVVIEDPGLWRLWRKRRRPPPPPTAPRGLSRAAISHESLLCALGGMRASHRVPCGY